MMYKCNINFRLCDGTSSANVILPLAEFADHFFRE